MIASTKLRRWETLAGMWLAQAGGRVERGRLGLTQAWVPDSAYLTGVGLAIGEWHVRSAKRALDPPSHHLAHTVLTEGVTTG